MLCVLLHVFYGMFVCCGCGYGGGVLFVQDVVCVTLCVFCSLCVAYCVWVDEHCVFYVQVSFLSVLLE